MLVDLINLMQQLVLIFSTHLNFKDSTSMLFLTKAWCQGLVAPWTKLILSLNDEPNISDDFVNGSRMFIFSLNLFERAFKLSLHPNSPPWRNGFLMQFRCSKK